MVVAGRGIALAWTLLLAVVLPRRMLTGAEVGVGQGAGELYRGKYVDRLNSRQHKVSGEVYAVDGRTLFIRGFTYDGTGPDAFFWTGFTEHPSPQGIIVPNEKGSKEALGAYAKQDLTITLPDGLSLRDVKWVAVWCRAYEVNFGDVYIPAELDFPQPHVIGSLSGQHGVSSGPIVVVDAQTILVPDFSYDGQAPDVHFWVGKGKPGPEGLRVTDETGTEVGLRKAEKKTMVLTLPHHLTIFNIDFFGVWCRLYYVDFGHVRIPHNINVPPSLKMLGVTPQTKLNCEVLDERLSLEVRWALAGESIVLQLVGRIEDGDYISFGLSGDESRSRMLGGDVIVASFDRAAGRGNVVDYFMENKAQCSGRSGVCPDSRLKAEANNVRLLSGTVVNHLTMLTFQRPLAAHDELDKAIRTNGSQAVIWAVGPLNERQEASYHSLHNRDDVFIDFGRPPRWNCPDADAELGSPDAKSPPALSPLAPEAEQRQTSVEVKGASAAWKVPPILCHEPEDRVFYAQMGPTGGSRGYSTITGKVGWGIAWYINGLLVPEVYLVRGKTYTFVVEGGEHAEIPAKHHPFYITDDSEGGYQHKSPGGKKKVRVFAGQGGTGTGRLCQWQESGHLPADSFASYGAYQRSLSLQCEDGHPGILHWTPDRNTPDTVYYQCFTHRYLGWKIHVVDRCEGDEAPAEPAFLPSEQLLSRRHGEDLPPFTYAKSRNGSEPIPSTLRPFKDRPRGPAETQPPSLHTQTHGNRDPAPHQRRDESSDAGLGLPPPLSYHPPHNAFLPPPLLPPPHASHLSPLPLPLGTAEPAMRKDATHFQPIDVFARGGAADFYVGSTRAPLLAYPIRYETPRPSPPAPSRPRPSPWPQSRTLLRTHGGADGQLGAGRRAEQPSWKAVPSEREKKPDLHILTDIWSLMQETGKAEGSKPAKGQPQSPLAA